MMQTWGMRAQPKTRNGFFMATFSLDIKGCKPEKDDIEGEVFDSFLLQPPPCLEWNPNPGATFKCFTKCGSRPGGNNSFCKWANIAEDIFAIGLVVDIFGENILGAAFFYGNFVVFSVAKPIQSATIEWFNSEASAFPREQKQRVPRAL